MSGDAGGLYARGMHAEQVAREVRAMTKREVFVMAIAGKLTWEQAGAILRMSGRHIRRLRARFEEFGVAGLMDRRGGRSRRRRVRPETIAEVCRLKSDVYPDWSMQHFHERVTEKHGLKLSYTLMRSVLQDAGIVEKARARGKYRRKRERRPMVGMLVHMDGSMHEWIDGLPKHDLVVTLDDADGRMLHARFFEEEGTHSTLVGLDHVLRKRGRFAEFYTDRGSHFCRTERAGAGPAAEQNGQVARVCKTLGIRQILAHSPQARGRSERAFRTIQGRLPQELRAAGVRSYGEANLYLDRVFVRDFNRKFIVQPEQSGSAFIPLHGVDLELLLSIHHDRVVANDSTITFGKLELQLPKTTDRAHYARCPVVVHELLDGDLAVSYLGRLMAQFTSAGVLRRAPKISRQKAA